MGVSFNISRQGKRYMHNDAASVGSQTDDQQNETEVVVYIYIYMLIYRFSTTTDMLIFTNPQI